MAVVAASLWQESPDLQGGGIQRERWIFAADIVAIDIEAVRVGRVGMEVVLSEVSTVEVGRRLGYAEVRVRRAASACSQR